jgi:hypothetical protein
MQAGSAAWSIRWQSPEAPLQSEMIPILGKMCIFFPFSLRPAAWYGNLLGFGRPISHNQ